MRPLCFRTPPLVPRQDCNRTNTLALAASRRLRFGLAACLWMLGCGDDGLAYDTRAEGAVATTGEATGAEGQSPTQHERDAGTTAGSESGRADAATEDGDVAEGPSQPDDHGGTGGGAQAPIEVTPDVDVVDYPLDPAARGAHHYEVAILMVNTTGPIPETSEPDVGGRQEHYTARELGDLYFSNPDGVASVIREASYGRTTLAGTVVGWFHDEIPGFSAERMIAERDRYFELAERVMDLSRYDVFVLHGLTDEGDSQMGWKMNNTIRTPRATYANVGINFMINSPVYTVPGSIYLYSVVLPSRSWAHELLHTFGITGHANSLWCASTTGAATSLGGECEQKSYGDVFSLMGENAFAVHPNGVMKEALGWLQSDQIATLHADQLHRPQTLDVYPLALDDGEVKSLRVELDHKVEVAGRSYDRLHLEYRTPVGFDGYLSRLDGAQAPDRGAFLSRYTPARDIQSEGLVVYLDSSDDSSDTTCLIDTHPDTAYHPRNGIVHNGNAGRFADAVLGVGERLDLDVLPFTVTARGVTDLGAMRVTFTPR